MAVTVTQYPTYPVPGKPVKITFATAADYVRVYLTDAPRKSKHYEEIQKADSTQVKLYDGDASRPWQFTPDVPGKFILRAYDITKGATAYGGGWYGSPDGERTETISDTSAGIEVIVGSKMQMQIGTADDSATLRFYVWDDYIRPTTVAAQGEATPAIVEPSSDRAEHAARACTLTTLENVYVPTALTGGGTVFNVFDLCDDIIDSYNDHRTNVGGVWHVAGDVDNTVSDDWTGADNPDRLAAAVAEILTKFDRHLRNDDGTGTGAAGYHGATDWDHATVADQPADMATSTVALCDLWRAYEAHRADTGAHTGAGGADTVNTLQTMAPLTLIVKTFMAELAKTSPTAQATENTGAVRLAAGMGMVEL